MDDFDMDEAHEDAKDEDIEWDIRAELDRITAAVRGTPASFPRVLTNAAFWMKVYMNLTAGDPAGMIVLADLARRLEVSVIDKRTLN